MIFSLLKDTRMPSGVYIGVTGDWSLTLYIALFIYKYIYTYYFLEIGFKSHD